MQNQQPENGGVPWWLLGHESGADRRADPFDPSGSAVRADNWGDAIMTMLGGALGATGVTGPIGMIGSLVASDALGQRPSISMREVIGREMADEPPTDRLLGANAGLEPGYGIARTRSEPVQSKREAIRAEKMRY